MILRFICVVAASVALGCSSSRQAPPSATGGAAAWDSGASNANDASADSGAPLADRLPHECAGICNAVTPTYPIIGDVSHGNITTYNTLASEGGACNYGKTQVMYYAAANVNVHMNDGLGQWQGGRICGQCVEIAALTESGVRTVVVRIMDRCADEWCGMDLGGDATGVIMGQSPGRYEGAWRLVSCAGHPEVSDGAPTLFVNSGSNPYWSLIQVRNPVWPVQSMSWQSASDPAQVGELEYANALSENYWVVPLAVLQANDTFDVTIHFTDGSFTTLRLTSAQLAAAGAQYPLEGSP